MDAADTKIPEDEDIERLLRLAGPREQLPDELKLAWEARFREELRTTTVSRRRHRFFWLGGLAASLAACALVLALTLRSNVTGQPPIEVRTLAGTSELIGPNGESAVLKTGTTIPPGSVVRTGARGRVALGYAGYTIRLDVDSEVGFSTGYIQLSRGLLYAADADQKMGTIDLEIRTPQGVVRDIGTQFTVRVDDAGTVATVRKGIIQVNAGNVESRVEATPGSAMRISVPDRGQASTRSVSPGGDEWRWIYAVAEKFELDGRSIHEFLTWSAGESGLQLRYASAAAELYARRERLHGGPVELDPERAVDPILESTDLSAQAQRNSLVVALRPRR